MEEADDLAALELVAPNTALSVDMDAEMSRMRRFGQRPEPFVGRTTGCAVFFG